MKITSVSKFTALLTVSAVCLSFSPAPYSCQDNNCAAATEKIIHYGETTDNSEITCAVCLAAVSVPDSLTRGYNYYLSKSDLNAASIHNNPYFQNNNLEGEMPRNY